MWRASGLSFRSFLYLLGLTVMIGLLLVGCGMHYWNKAGSGANEFARDSAECARDNSV